MNATTFRVIREGLGHTRDSMAALLEVREKTVREWELGQRPIGTWVDTKLDDLLEVFLDEVDELKATDEVETLDRLARAKAWAALVLDAA